MAGKVKGWAGFVAFALFVLGSFASLVYGVATLAGFWAYFALPGAAGLWLARRIIGYEDWLKIREAGLRRLLGGGR